MLPRPPSSTLFPYTTLFRSVWRQDQITFFHEKLFAVYRRVSTLALDHKANGRHIVTVRSRHLARIYNREGDLRSEEHTSELQSRLHLVCRLLLEKKKQRRIC